MSAHDTAARSRGITPGEREEEAASFGQGLRTYVTGLVFAVVLTAASFWAASTNLIYGPAMPVALVVFAIAQMGVHLVFFLHITTAPDHTNNIMALAFGILIVCLIIFGSFWIMDHMNAYMMPTDKMMQMQR